MNLKTLAKELNLSFSTVSKALRDSHEISSSTKARVVAKAKELNYQVNPLASSFRRQKTKTIAVIIPEVVNDFFGPVINGIESIAQEKGYHVLIYLTHEDTQKEIAITQLLQTGRVDGIMMSLSANTINTDHIEKLKEKEIPLVFFDRIAESIHVPKVITNDYESGKTATEHLIENGCTKIAFLGISPHLSIINKRMNGYLDTLKKYKIEYESKLISFCDSDERKNSSTLMKLLKGKNRPDGIFASIEHLALTTYDVCNQLNIRIPEDIKIVCFSNLKTARLLKPSLTTITQPAFEIGKEAASILFKIIEKKGHHFLTEKTILNSNLIKRHSTEGDLAGRI